MLHEQLAIEYQELMVTLEQGMAAYLGLIERTFSPDVETALSGSVELAGGFGVAPETILVTDEKIIAFFLD